MTNSIWEAIANTPWWVFVLFIFLVRIGLLATKPHVIPIKQLFILPVIFFVLSLVSMLNMKLTAFNLILWAGAIVIGSLFGWLHFRFLRIKAVQNQARLYIPGSWNVLVIILTIFAAKYYYGYEIALNPQQLTDPKFAAGLVAFYGLFTGLFIGRMTFATRCLKIGPYITAEDALKPKTTTWMGAAKPPSH